ncbi:MAG: hypothetical protein BWY89_01506 [Bacteroidetes bacterium ADurb.BinA012]|nr:MAG: hypothetical protein BWY89_01506 [Bacteroidetes bacterium ADurb.BinA012]
MSVAKTRLWRFCSSSASRIVVSLKFSSSLLMAWVMGPAQIKKILFDFIIRSICIILLESNVLSPWSCSGVVIPLPPESMVLLRMK